MKKWLSGWKAVPISNDMESNKQKQFTAASKAVTTALAQKESSSKNRKKLLGRIATGDC